MTFDYCPNCTQLPQPLTRDHFEELIRQPWLSQLAADIAAGNLDRKRNLPAVCWQAAFDGQRRSNQHARHSGLFALDIDHIEEPHTLYQSFEARIAELGIYIVHMTPSTHGLRIVAQCRPGLTTIADNQAWLAREIHVEHDACTRDFARLSFLVPQSYFYHYNAAIFTDTPQVILPNDDGGEAPAPVTVDTPPPTSQADLHFRGIAYADIVSELIDRTGGQPFEGERNNRLYLICRLLANITDRQPDRLFEVCPRFGLSEAEVRACCESACKSARTEKMPYILYKVLRELGAYNHDGEGGGDGTPTVEPPAAPTFPEVNHLPPLIREFVATAPPDFQAATAMACLPICGFLGSRMRARYLDGELQAPSFIVNIIAPAASGKGQLLRIPDICLARVREMDAQGREEEAEFQRLSRLRKNEKKQLAEPQPIVRDIPAKVSVAQLLKRMVQARGLHLISISPEADTLTNSNRAGVWAQKSDIYRIAQDTDGGRYGQDYMSDISFSATCKMRYNLLTLGTPGAIARAYPDVEDGLISRCIMVTLPSQFGKAMPVRQEFSARQLRIVEERIAALMAISQDAAGEVLPEHHLQLDWLNNGMAEWLEEQRLTAIRDDDHARDQFMRRAALIGFRAGMVATFLWGSINKERKAHILEFALWVAESVMLSLYSRYSTKVNEQAHEYETPVARRYPSLFEAMSDIFTMADLQKAARAQSIHSPLKSIIFRWTDNHLIDKQGDKFVKLTK